MTRPDQWSEKYLGIGYTLHGSTFEACDCWGLVRLVFDQEHRLKLPRYTGPVVCTDEQAEARRFLDAEKDSGRWVSVDENAKPFDLVTFRHGSVGSHIGIVVRMGLMLHVARNDRAKIEPYDRPRWWSRRSGTFRHNLFAGQEA